MTTDSPTLTDENNYEIDKAADFLAPIFAENGWIYGRGASVPDGARLAQTITHLAQSLLDDETIEWTSSGRITVLRSWNDEDNDSFDIEIKLDVGSFTVETPEESALDKVRTIAEVAASCGYDSPELAEIRRILAEVS